MLDLNLLKIMKHRVEFNRLMKSIPLSSVDPKTKAILDDFKRYYEKFPDHDVVDMQLFIPRFEIWHKNLKEEQLTVYRGILRQIGADVDDTVREGILSDLFEIELAETLANLAVKFESGDLNLPISDLVTAAIDRYRINIGAKAIPWCDTSIEDLLQEDMNSEGYLWRTNCLNGSMRPLRPGDFGIVAGRPDKGKTTFLASEITYMAPQLPEHKNVLWFNNEGPGNRIKKRIWQSALGLRITEMVEIAQEHPGRIREMFIDIMGRTDKIRVLDIHGWHVGQVEAVMQQAEPGIIVFDMIDNIRGFSGDNARTDQALESMYQWGREKAVQYEFVGLASSQISAEGDGMQFPTLSMLKESKTGKQGACDFQLMIGARNDEGFENNRYLSLPKNKLSRDDGPKDPRTEVLYRPSIGRYEDIADE